jgi:hypothetical protein
VVGKASLRIRVDVVPGMRRRGGAIGGGYWLAV